MPDTQAVNLRLSPRWPEFNRRPVRGRFGVDKSALGEVFLRIRRFSHGCITVPTLLHLHVALLPEGQTGEPGNVMERLWKSGEI
jgi:hypothetical protein